MQINITQEHIDAGITDDGKFCPIAHAIKNAYPNHKDLHVSRGEITLDGTEYLLPDAAMTFIYRFDNKQEVEPFTFSTLT